MASFADRINYSSCNEDGRSELRALGISSADRVLCITGSGARPLDLLTASPKSIVSIDCNPYQNALLELKIAAIRELPYHGFLAFIGIRRSTQRKATYVRMRSRLSAAALAYWDHHQKGIADGIIYCGRWEKYFRILAKLFRMARPALVDRLFSCQNVTRQREIWNTEWNNKVWRFFLRAICQRFAWKYGFGDPGFYQFVAHDFSVFKYISGKLDRGAASVDFAQSAFLTILFFGEFKENWALPLHLQSQYYGAIKANLDRVTLCSKTLLACLANGSSPAYDKYSLSDIASYTSSSEYKATWKGLISRARKNARFCERQFLVKRKLPSELGRAIMLDPKLEREIEATDDSLFYTFQIGQIQTLEG